MEMSSDREKKTFSTFSNLSTRECKFCTKMLRNKTACRIHEAHCKSKKNFWICDQCSKTFKTEIGLISHKSEHDDSVSKKFECSSCLKAYKNLSDLRKHCEMLSHNYPVVEGPLLEGEVRCNICYRIIKSIYMETHMKYTHKQEKSYKCDKCGYTTMRKNHYLRHLRHKHNEWNMNFDVIRKHFEENQSYVCPKCDRVFDTCETAEDHLVLKNCEDENYLICKICSIKFTMKQNHKAHMRRKHPEVQDLSLIHI